MGYVRPGVAVVGSCRYDPDEGYVLEITGPIEMVRTGDRRQDILANTRRLAVIMEGYVRAHPEQWMMFHPLWPESSTGKRSRGGQETGPGQRTVAQEGLSGSEKALASNTTLLVEHSFSLNTRFLVYPLNGYLRFSHHGFQK